MRRIGRVYAVEQRAGLGGLRLVGLPYPLSRLDLGCCLRI